MRLALARPPVIDAVLVFGADQGSGDSNSNSNGGGGQAHSLSGRFLKEGNGDGSLGSGGTTGVGNSQVEDRTVTLPLDTHQGLDDGTYSRGYGAAANLSLQLTQVRIRMNHSDVPPTQFLLDAFDVQPSRINGLSLYRRWAVCTSLVYRGTDATPCCWGLMN
jgi:hypothetical protein